MAYTPTKTHYGIGILILIAILLWVGYKYWGWFGGSSKPSAPKDGTACTTTAGTSGTYKNGVCTDAGGAPGGGPSGEQGQRTTYVPTNPLNQTR